MKNKYIQKNKIQLIFLLLIVLLIPILSLTRIILPSEIDDVSPEIYCEQEYIKKANVLWVIPKYNNISIFENKEWCNYILSLNKTLGLHGYMHTYEEFNSPIPQEQISESIDIFEKCFGYKPTIFKPPQIAISKANEKLLKENNLNVKKDFHQITRKVYHCNDTGRFSNRIINLF